MGRGMGQIKLKLAPDRKLIITQALRQALEILQMPHLELAQWLRTEIEKNPLLEIDSSETSQPRPMEASHIPSQPHLYDHLMHQVRERFSSPLDRMIAEEILDHLDEKGFLSAPLEQIALFFNKSSAQIESILRVLQSFDPPGICARNLQESLLLQLKAQNQIDSPAYLLVSECFDDLLHGRYLALKKKLGPIDLPQAIQKLARLHFRPASLFSHDPTPVLYPDLQITKVEGGWTVELMEDELPEFSLQYQDVIPDTREELDALRSFTTSAKWLLRSLTKRRKLLLKAGRFLTCKQARYLNQKGSLLPLTLKEIAEELSLHESTVSRLLSGKYAATPRGILPLKSLLTVSPETETAKAALSQLIAHEDKRKPLTDDELAETLRARGHLIARRTIAKYRKSLKIGPASQRKNLS